MYDIYNNIGIDELSIGNTDYSNIELDNIFKSNFYLTYYIKWLNQVRRNQKLSVR